MYSRIIYFFGILSCFSQNCQEYVPLRLPKYICSHLLKCCILVVGGFIKEVSSIYKLKKRKQKKDLISVS